MAKPKVNKRDFAKMVLAALRGGKYKQTIGQLKGRATGGKGTGYCCLGVVGDCLVKLKIGYKWEGGMLITPMSVGSDILDPSQPMVNEGELNPETRRLIGMTDDMQQEGVSMNDLSDEETADYTPVPFALIADMWEIAWKEQGIL